MFMVLDFINSHIYGILYFVILCSFWRGSRFSHSAVCLRPSDSDAPPVVRLCRCLRTKSKMPTVWPACRLKRFSVQAFLVCPHRFRFVLPVFPAPDICFAIPDSAVSSVLRAMSAIFFLHNMTLPTRYYDPPHRPGPDEKGESSIHGKK